MQQSMPLPRPSLSRRALGPLVLALAATLAGCSSTVTGTSGVPSATPSPSPSLTGPHADVEAMLLPVPAGYVRERDRPGDVGYITPAEMVKAKPQDSARLQQDGYQFTWSQAWRKSSVVFEVWDSIAVYGSATGATDIAAMVNTEYQQTAVADGSVTAPLPVTGIPGAFGLIEKDSRDNLAIYTVAFSKGRYHSNIVITTALTPITVDDDPATIQPLAVQLAQQQYARISA
jgi:hypothetical protein